VLTYPRHPEARSQAMSVQSCILHFASCAFCAFCILCILQKLKHAFPMRAKGSLQDVCCWQTAQQGEQSAVSSTVSGGMTCDYKTDESSNSMGCQLLLRHMCCSIDLEWMKIAMRV